MVWVKAGSIVVRRNLVRRALIDAVDCAEKSIVGVDLGLGCSGYAGDSGSGEGEESEEFDHFD